MTEDELAELIDLSLDDTLPEALRGHVEAHLAANPDAARDAAALRLAVARLKAAPAERPDAWFMERALGRLLQEHAEESPPGSFLATLPIRKWRG